MNQRAQIFLMNVLDDPRFDLVPSGRFRDRFGPMGRDASFSSKKLCLVATDPACLVEVLYGISLRPDCFYVKYGVVARAGMYLGRVFLATDHAASELCQALKDHPRLMVSLQDDDWFHAFREPPAGDDVCGVREEWPEHEPQVARVLDSAFERPDESRLVAALRAARAVTVSLVAELAPNHPEREAWPIVGHVLLSPVTLEGARDPLGLGLAPLAVLPSHQRKGIGVRLVETALRRARLLGHAYVVVIGDPKYYSRFGFAPAAQFGLSCPGTAFTLDFLALELVPDALLNASGVVQYHPAFSRPADSP